MANYARVQEGTIGGTGTVQHRANVDASSKTKNAVKILRSTLRTIMATQDSRRIYFFLCLNLAYMVVQMAYGIWTNSLGLISDCTSTFLTMQMGSSPGLPYSNSHVFRLSRPRNGIICFGHGQLGTE